MIRELRIRNLALIDDLSLQCGEGFSVFTGETGAGKSILIGAIGLLLGERASAEQIRSGTDEAEVSGVFEMPTARPGLAAILDEQGITLDEGELIVRRAMQRSGRNKVYVNQVPVPLATLKRIGDLLVDMHGQHDHQFLLQDESAMAIINGLSTVHPAWATYGESYARYRSAVAALEEHDRQARELAQRRDVIEFQCKELTSLALKTGEEAQLEAQLKLLSSSAQRVECATAISEILGGGDEPAVARVAAAKKHLQALARYDSAAASWLADTESALTTLSELESFAGSYAEKAGAGADPRRLEHINERVARIQKLKKKYQCDADGLLTKRDELAAALAGLENAEADQAQLERAVEQALGMCRKTGTVLTAARASACKALDRGIVAQMEKLGFNGGSWKSEFTPLEQPGPGGMEECRFMVRTNPGEPFLPLAKTASGGEISRLMLAIKSVLARQDNIPILIFDEIDTGIGGVVAGEVASCMAGLGATHQVFCISHLHQIAALATRHYRVFKESEKGRTVTHVKLLDKNEQVDEIARMLGGESEIAKSHARELLKKRIK